MRCASALTSPGSVGGSAVQAGSTGSDPADVRSSPALVGATTDVTWYVVIGRLNNPKARTLSAPRITRSISPRRPPTCVITPGAHSRLILVPGSTDTWSVSVRPKDGGSPAVIGTDVFGPLS